MGGGKRFHSLRRGVPSSEAYVKATDASLQVIDHYELHNCIAKRQESPLYVLDPRLPFHGGSTIPLCPERQCDRGAS
jgi:hypothetical protein